MSDLTDVPFAGNVEGRELSDEMRASYLDYAMSVIVSRALPDVRDGLKPVHRRVLYAMSEAGVQPSRQRVKCAQVVGVTMADFHPHGDQSIYDTLVRMAQPFSMRHKLVDGQGNFGNVDGYSAAAMRYTECRLAPMATQLLRDLDQRTVDFKPNYNGQKQEPYVLPSRFPNLLVNGASGIAVGMATNIPPHNLGETIDACVAMLDDPQIDTDGLLRHVKGPDFPTGGIIMGLGPIREAYDTGRGRIRVRARTEIEELKSGVTAIVVTELPFQVKKGGEDGFIRKIADLVKEKVLPEIADVRDESADEGMRVVIHLRRDAMAQQVLQKLFKHTALQSTFGVNMVALVDDVPRTLSLRSMIHHYLDHQREVVTRRTRHQLLQAERRAHILEGLSKALDHIDEVIALIRASRAVDEARSGLMETFELSEEQAQAILDLRLQRLTNMQQAEIRDELARLQELIAELRAILGDEARVARVVREELLEIRSQYADERRTEIVPFDGDIDDESMILDEDVAILVTQSGYVKRMALDAYRAQRRGGVGVRGMATKDDDTLAHLFVATALDYVLFFSSLGKVYRVKAYQIPEQAGGARGKALVNLLPLAEGERILTVFRTRNYSEGRFLVMATKRGIVKKTPFSDYDTVLRADGIIALRMRPDDELIGVRLTSGSDSIVLVSRNGSAVRFDETSARTTGRASYGVLGMRLRSGDEVIALGVASHGTDLLVVTENGYGKRTPIDEYPEKGRGTMGVLTVRLTDARGRLAGAAMVTDGDELLLITEAGTITRQSVDEIGRYGRATQGVKVQTMREDDRVGAFVTIRDEAGVDGDADGDAPSPGSGGDRPDLPADTTGDPAEGPGDRSIDAVVEPADLPADEGEEPSDPAEGEARENLGDPGGPAGGAGLDP